MDSSFQIEPTNKKLKLFHDLDDHNDQDYAIHGDNFVLQNLPRDVLLDILIRLPISCLIQFKLVCHSWNSLSMDPELARVHHVAMAKNDPMLMFHCDYPIRNQLSFVELSSNDHDENIVRKISIPFCNSMPEFNVVGSCNGLLCMSDSLYREPVYVFNPFSRDYLELPKSKQFDEQEVIFGFGFHPVTKEYKVVKIVYYRNSHGRKRVIRNIRNYPKSEVQVLTISKQMNKSSWRCIGKMPYQIDRQLKGVALVNGRLHWLSRLSRVSGVLDREIISFDLKSEKFEVVKKASNMVVINSNHHLATVQGCLAVVAPCGYGKLEIWVMKQYGIKESWMKEFVIHGAYHVKAPNHEYQHGIWRQALSKRMVRVLCVLKNGEILLEYRGGRLVKYDPKWKEFKNVVFPKMPKLCQTIVHVGTLNWVHN
uniref:F-box protein At3g07870-like n=1 Tax=Erigeron canadensis TaxID=72917 RepID=UPI001CB988D0|nr:F-box protein At3g07870-like [Erigeron canadensis]